MNIRADVDDLVEPCARRIEYEVECAYASDPERPDCLKIVLRANKHLRAVCISCKEIRNLANSKKHTHGKRN